MCRFYLVMNESFREQRPLLYDDSDEENFSRRIGNKYKVSSLKGGVNYKIKGAAEIISRWPDHWSSVLYWWIVVGMIVITVMVICNIMLTFSYVPPSYSFNEQTSIARTTKETRYSSQSNNVFMHVFISNNEEQVLNKYLPYLNKIIDDFSELQFYLVVVLNDVTAYHNVFMQNNEIAVNRLKPNLRDKRVAITNIKNIEVQRISLTEYLDSSPIEKYWRSLSPKLTPFLVRIISVWEKGGVAFDPTIFRLSNTNYYNNVFKVLSDHRIKLLKNYEREQKWQGNINNKVNNIQDVIKNLDSDNHFEETLEEAENRQVIEKVTPKRNINHAVEISSSTNTNKVNPISKSYPKLIGEEEGDNQDIPTAADILPPLVDSDVSNNRDVLLTIDIYGKIIESNVQCHAFIGQIFTNVAHNLQYNVTDFIINELSLFCKGNLSYCYGVEIISL